MSKYFDAIEEAMGIMREDIRACSGGETVEWDGYQIIDYKVVYVAQISDRELWPQDVAVAIELADEYCPDIVVAIFPQSGRVALDVAAIYRDMEECGENLVSLEVVRREVVEF